MGLFGRDKRDDVLNDWSTDDQSLGIDFEKYELGQLGEDIRAMVDVPGAVIQASKWALGIPIVVALISSGVFSGRMSNWILIPFVFGVFVLSLLASIVFGVYAVTRKRLNLVTDASGRVVNTLGEMHSDVVELKEGAADTSMQKVAIGLFENAIFPMVTGAVSATSGPLSFITSRAIKVPMSLIERSVVAAIKVIPDRKIGEIVDDQAESIGALTEVTNQIGETYQSISVRIDEFVGLVSRKTLGSLIGVGVASMLPLLIWLLVGWMAS